MSSRLTAPKGFEDILPDQSWKWQHVEHVARETAELFRFQEIRTPVLEHSALFHRGVGETSDIVHKETFTFTDRGGESMTMRPEGTAGVVRAAIEHNLLGQEGARAKLWYLTSNFRYERPQKGRVRQHHQFGAEAFGVAEPEQDVECIALQMEFYRRCGVKELSLRVNSLGDAESKQRYREALVRFLSPKASSLSEDSQRRLGENPLRILDSKDPRDIATREGAPPAGESLSEKSRTHFEKVQRMLTGLGLSFTVDATLVRGFDYYTDTLWEVTAGGLGAQNAIGGGGRYDNLVEMLGGRPTPGVGFGSGIERLLIALEAQGVQLPRPQQKLVWLVSHGEVARDANFKLAAELRRTGVTCDMDLSGRSVKNQFKVASREQAAYCVVIGEEELANGTFVLKDMASGEQTTVTREELVLKLTAK
jgi:histidyl-tRNA synthetase